MALLWRAADRESVKMTVGVERLPLAKVSVQCPKVCYAMLLVANRPKGCGYPPSPGEYGDMYYSSTDYGSEIRYSCRPGYDMQGTDTLTCLHGGKYSGKPPVCYKRKATYR